MLLPFIFIHCFSMILASYNFNSTYVKAFRLHDDNQTYLIRYPRQRQWNRRSYVENSSCERMTHTSPSPFIALLLYKTSGHFLGMGSILDKRTVLTATQAIEQAEKKHLLVLAGSLSPWWGKDSQVRRVSEVLRSDWGVAIAILNGEFFFNKNIYPMGSKFLGSQGMWDTQIAREFTRNWAIYGVRRSSLDAPGEPIAKGAIYTMSVETQITQPYHLDSCISSFPEWHTYYPASACTWSNKSYLWGCVGSPTVAKNKAGELTLLAVVAKAKVSGHDLCHIHVRFAFFEDWIRSHSIKTPL